METKTRRNLFFAILFVLTATSILAGVLLDGLSMPDERLHTYMESAGALAALTMAGFLILRQPGGIRLNMFLPALGFICVGVLDSFHAIIPPGDSFVFLHSIAVLLGGFFFALVWIDLDDSSPMLKLLPPVVAAGCTGIGLWVMYYGFPPELFFGGDYSRFLRGLNIISGFLYILASIKMLMDFNRTGRMEAWFFALVALLFGLPGLILPGMRLWDGVWWLWHLERLITYITIFIWLFNRYRTGINVMTATLESNQRTQERLSESEMRFRQMLENVQLVAVMLDIEGRVVFCNSYLLEVAGWEKDEPLGRDWFDNFVPPNDRNKVRQFFKKIISTAASPPPYENTIMVRGGGGRLISWNNAVQKDSAGNIVGTMSIGVDITQKTELERQKSNLLAMITHDLKQPLTLILGYSELLMELDAQPDEKSRSNISHIRHCGVRILSMVEDFLAVSRLESGNMELNRDICELGEILGDVCVEYHALAHTRNLQFSNDIGRDLPTLFIDIDKVGRALENLLQNAFNYTPEGGCVRLTARRKVDHVEIQVMDTGRGIPADEQHRIFDSYYRSPKVSAIKGSGLGLTIVKAVAEAHGGRVELESEPDIGTIFRFILPLASVDV